MQRATLRSSAIQETSFLTSSKGKIGSSTSGTDVGRDSWEHLEQPYSHLPGQAVGEHELWVSPAVQSVSPDFLPEQPDPDVDWCPLPILHHEPYNTQESWHVWNFTSHLLQAGASFCKQPERQRHKLFARWRERLDEVSAHHRGNNAFVVYFSTYEEGCKRMMAQAVVRRQRGLPHVDWQDHVRRTFDRRFQDLENSMEGTRRVGPCDMGGLTTKDVIDSYGNDTELLLAMGKALIEHAPATEKKLCASLSDDRRTVMREAIGHLPADNRVTIRHNRCADDFFHGWGTWMLTLGTAYHKIQPICSKADYFVTHDDSPNNFACRSTPMLSDPDGRPVYDFIPMDPSRGYCYGEPCRLGARAIDAHRAFLHEFSGVRRARPC